MCQHGCGKLLAVVFFDDFDERANVAQGCPQVVLHREGEPFQLLFGLRKFIVEAEVFSL